jgi:hypothetical protein
MVIARSETFVLPPSTEITELSVQLDHLSEFGLFSI